MQKIFSKHKRKHPQDGHSDEREPKHTKHENRHSYTSSSSKSVDRLSQSFKPSLSEPPKTKLANLIKALDDALEEEGMDEVLSLVGDETLNRCLDLRTSLSKHRSQLDATAFQSPPASQPQPRKSLDISWNLPQTMSPFSLTPWKSSTIPLMLPRLPRVLDPTLEAAAFIHVSLGSGSPSDLSYERLEWVGDAYVYLISTLLISQTFPALTPGKSSQMRERLVKNVTLAEYSRQYGFEKRAQLPRYLQGDNKDQDRIKVMGDIFESYVAAVVLSDPANGVRRVSEWLKDVWGMTLAKDILYQERNGMWHDSPLWRLRGKAEPVQHTSRQAEPENAKMELQRLLGARDVQIVYKDAAPEKKDPNNKLPLFTIGVYLTGWGERDRMLGSGKANGKKDAGMKAAEMALANKKMMKGFLEKKKMFDEQMEMEKAALEKSGGA